MSFKIKLDKLTIEITKLDTDEYEFKTTYQYLDYWGKSFIKSLSFVEDLQGYLNSIVDKCSVDYFDKYIILTFPIAFSSKCEIIQLNKPDINEIQELKILIKKQEEVIQELNCRLTVHDKAVEYEQNKMATLDLTYDAKGWNLDIDGYLSKPNSNKHNLDYLMQFINDQLGFTSKKIPYSNTAYYQCGPPNPNPIIDYPDKYSNLEVMISKLQEQSIMPNMFESICCPGIKVNNIRSKYPLHCAIERYIQKLDNPPGYIFNNYLKAFNCKKLAIIQYEIPQETIIYARIPFILNSSSYISDEMRIMEAISILLKKHGFSKNTLVEAAIGTLATYVYI